MIIYDNYNDTPSDKMLNRFPRVQVELFPGGFGRWYWEVTVRTDDPVWTHWHHHDGQRWGLTRAIRAAMLVGYEVEHAAFEEQLAANPRWARQIDMMMGDLGLDRP